MVDFEQVKIKWVHVNSQSKTHDDLMKAFKVNG